MKPAKVDGLAQNVKIQHNIYFEEMIAQWLASRQDSAKESTYAYYTYMVKNHLIPVLGQLPVWDITSGVLENFLQQKQKAGKLDGTGGLSPKTMSDLRSIFRSFIFGDSGCSVSYHCSKPWFAEHLLHYINKLYSNTVYHTFCRIQAL